MANIKTELRTDLLHAMRFDAGQAEQSPPSSIFPVPEHVRALEPEVVLVIGDRGAGKTQLKNALVDDRVRTAVLRFAPGVRGPVGGAWWVDGWPLGTRGPDGNGWQAVASRATPADARDLWMALLARSVANSGLGDLDKAALGSVLSPRGADPLAILESYRAVASQVTNALDLLDERLEQMHQWLFVAYDELDVLAPSDWDAMGFAIRGLVSLWASYARRWKRLRPKIFLRSDFYKHHRDVAGADVGKLGANRVDLVWSDKNLYGALVKHVLNKPHPSDPTRHPLRDYFRKSVKTQDDPVLGVIPLLTTPEDAKPFVERLVDEYMGANRQKGLAFRWLLDHIRDGNGRALPRSLVWLVELAATDELDRGKATGAHLLHHTSVRRALDRVSEQYVQQAETHELQWLSGLRVRLSATRIVPWTRRAILKLLSVDFEGSWSAQGGHRPPGHDAEEALVGLIELGVVRERPNNTFDVPDLYLHGLGLLRHGGVAKK